jgi:hypothetical protein
LRRVEEESEVNAMAALLRGTIGAEGDPELLVLFARTARGAKGWTSYY